MPSSAMRAVFFRLVLTLALLPRARPLSTRRLAPRMGPLPWGKRPCQDLLAEIRRAEPRPLGAGLVEVHPLRHLVWAAPEARAADGGAAPPRPQDFDAANSACAMHACVGIDWRRAFDVAVALENGAACPADAAAYASGGDWVVADARSLEVVVAHACLDRRLAVRRVPGGPGVRLDAARAAPMLRRAGLAPPPSAPAGAFPGPRVAAAALASTRDLEAPVWPKAFHFAKAFAGLDAAARDARFGAVPLRRLESGVWATGSRHRPMGALLAGADLLCRPVARDAA